MASTPGDADAGDCRREPGLPPSAWITSQSMVMVFFTTFSYRWPRAATVDQALNFLDYDRPAATPPPAPCAEWSS
ncbi:MAG: hypothetical protein IPK48_15200 [Gammaproteobacteria bacterium]|nr:hypothetical protein [Gammaproteobacteria bacterium]